MKTFEELKERTTPEIIEKMVELAEGFEVTERQITVGNQLLISRGIKYNINSCETTKDFSGVMVKFSLFPLLLHRAVEGWNNARGSMISIHKDAVVFFTDNCEGYNDDFNFEKYEPCHLTQCEMAIWDCLLEVIK